jgi:hypothetical protein
VANRARRQAVREEEMTAERAGQERNGTAGRMSKLDVQIGPGVTALSKAQRRAASRTCGW